MEKPFSKEKDPNREIKGNAILPHKCRSSVYIPQSTVFETQQNMKARV